MWYSVVYISHFTLI